MKKYRQKSPKPADEAWMKMAEMLDAEMPASNQKSKKRAFAISFSQFAISIVAAIVLVGGGTFITLKTIENKKEIYTIKHAVRLLDHDSLTTKTVQIEDPAISTKTDIQTINSANQKGNEENKLQQHQNKNQTSLSIAITQIHSPQKAVSVKNLNLIRVFVDNHGLKANKSNNITNLIEKQHDATFVDTVNSQNYQLNNILLKDENLFKVDLKTKIGLNDSLDVRNNSPIVTVSTNEKDKNRTVGSNSPKTNHLFVGLSGYYGLLFSNKTSMNIYSYGEILTIGMRNTKYNFTVETGIGFQSLEYHVPYSRTLYTYHATGIYDSTITVSSYKYSRYNVIIPVFITKEIFQYNNIFLNVKTGINTSVFLSKQRLFNQLPADIKLIEDSYPISNINFSFAVSPQFRWDINDKFSLNINAGGIFYLNSLFQNYSLKPIGINFSAGMHYFF